MWKYLRLLPNNKLLVVQDEYHIDALVRYDHPGNGHRTGKIIYTEVRTSDKRIIYGIFPMWKDPTNGRLVYTSNLESDLVRIPHTYIIGAVQ